MKEKGERMISHKIPSVNYTAEGEMFTWTNDMERMVSEFEKETREIEEEQLAEYYASLVDDREENE